MSCCPWNAAPGLVCSLQVNAGNKTVELSWEVTADTLALRAEHGSKAATTEVFAPAQGFFGVATPEQVKVQVCPALALLIAQRQCCMIPRQQVPSYNDCGDIMVTGGTQPAGITRGCWTGVHLLPGWADHKLHGQPSCQLYAPAAAHLSSPRREHWMTTAVRWYSYGTSATSSILRDLSEGKRSCQNT